MISDMEDVWGDRADVEGFRPPTAHQMAYLELVPAQSMLGIAAARDVSDGI